MFVVLGLLRTLHKVRMLLGLFAQIAFATLLPFDAFLLSASFYFLPIDFDSHVVVLESRDSFVIYNL